MPLPLLAGIGSMIGGAGSAIGGMAGGIGSMLGSAGMFGAAATGSAGATTGLLGAGGQFGAFQAMGTLGMGMGLMQAFGGGASVGTAPTEKVKLTERGEQLQK